MPPLELSVLVASHDRPLRLRWLLNALSEQTLERSRWEVIVCHDSAGPETDALLAEHELARDGTLRHRRFPSGSAAASAKRNAALALARAPAVVFTDDDCRPPAGWLEGVRAAVADNPGAIVQGPMQPDPDEAVMLRSPFPHTQAFASVPRVWAEACNIAYPHELVSAVGGFAEDLEIGEDTDLCLRAVAAGARFTGDQRMLSYHSVSEGSLPDRLRQAGRWGDMAKLIARQPALRSELYLRVFWKPAHAGFLLALLGLGLGLGRRPPRGWLPVGGYLPPLALALPWALARQDHGGGARGRLRQLAALPSWALIDAAELAVLARSSVRYRSLVL